MHSIIKIVDVKIYFIQKSKRHTLKYSSMFRITQDPSSGRDELYLIEIIYNGSIVLIMCVVGVWRHILDLWCVCMLCWSGNYCDTQYFPDQHSILGFLQSYLLEVVSHTLVDGMNHFSLSVIFDN